MIITNGHKQLCVCSLPVSVRRSRRTRRSSSSSTDTWIALSKRVYLSSSVFFCILHPSLLNWSKVSATLLNLTAINGERERERILKKNIHWTLSWREKGATIFSSETHSSDLSSKVSIFHRSLSLSLALTSGAESHASKKESQRKSERVK